MGAIFKDLLYLFHAVFLLNACDGEVLFRTKPCEEGTVRQGNACVSETGTVDAVTSTSTPVASSSCKDTDLSKLQKGETVTMCDGSIGEGKLVLASEIPGCTQDGQQDCVNKSKFKAVDSSLLDSAKIAKGTTIGGVTGSLRGRKQCRNYSDLTTFDASYPPSTFGWNMTTFLPAAVNAGANQITFGSAHGLITNSPVRFTTTTTLPAPLVAGTTYYAVYVSNTVIALASVVSGAQIDITTQGTGTHTALDAADGMAQYFDTIEDYNNNLATGPSNNPWSNSDYLCDASNFVNVTSTTSPLLPSGLTPTNGTQPFTQIWQDQISGVYFSNILHVMGSGRNWSDGILLCESLNGSTAGNGWYMPTQKELMQLYVNGISKVPLAGGSVDTTFSSSTIISTGSIQAWSFRLSTGSPSASHRNGNLGSVICVR